MLAATKKPDGSLTGATGQIDVSSAGADPIPGIGDKAPVVHTDTLETAKGDISKIDTRKPPSDMHKVDFADVVGKKPVALLFSTPQLCQSFVCGPVTDMELQMQSKYGDKMTFIHQEVYVDNDINKGLRKPLQQFNLRTEPWLFVVNAKGIITARLEGSIGVTAVRERGQVRAVRRRVLAAVATARRRRRARAGGRRGARPRPAPAAADPAVAVRLGGRGGAGDLVLRAGGAVAAAAARARRLAPGAGRARARLGLPVQIVCGAIGVALLVVTILAGYLGSGTALDNWAPTFLLITFWVGMVFVSILFGDVYRAFSPFRALGRLLPSLNRPYPERLGRWPAAAGLLIFTWIELVSGLGR